MMEMERLTVLILIVPREPPVDQEVKSATVVSAVLPIVRGKNVARMAVEGPVLPVVVLAPAMTEGVNTMGAQVLIASL